MRLRMAVIATAVLVVFGTFVVAHRRARAEQVRLAQLQTEASEREAGAAPAAGGSGVATALPAAPALVAEAPATTLPATSSSVVAPGRVPAVAGSAPNFIGAQPAYAAPSVMTYFVAASDDPETNELTSQDQQLEQEVQSLARQLADSDDDKQRAELKDNLSTTLEKQFDTQQKLRQLEISRIEARVQKLRELVRKRTDSRRKIIENRLEQLLNDAEGLGWNSGKGTGYQVVAPRPIGAFAVPPAVPAPPAVPFPPTPARTAR